MPKQDAGPDAPDRFVVLHTAVEAYYRGQVITIDHLKRGLDRAIDLDRLLALGAIAPLDSDRARAVQAEVGPGAVTPENVPVADAVPLPPPDATVPRPQPAFAS